MIKEKILLLLILWDWVTHIWYAFFPLDFIIYRLFSDLVLGVGYNNFWITYWGFALVLIILIILEKR